MKTLILTAQDARELASVGGLTITKPIKPAPPYTEGAALAAYGPGQWLLIGPDGNRLAAEKAGEIYTPTVQPGDAVYIREPWHYRHELNSNDPDEVTLASELSPEEAKGRKWASPVSMPESAARHFARVVSVGTAYGPGVAPVWLVELEAVEKAAAVAIDAGLPFSAADDPENASDYYTYSGDMTAEEHEHMVAAIDADRARLAQVQDRIVWMKRRRAKIADDLPKAETEQRTPETKTSRADALRIEDAALADELDELTVEEGNLRAALEDAGAPVQTVEERARERLAELEKRSLEVSHSIADTRAADACGTPAELAETREALTREAERLSAEAANSPPTSPPWRPRRREPPRPRARSHRPGPRRAQAERTTRRSARSRSENASIAGVSGASPSRARRAAGIPPSARRTPPRPAFVTARRPP